ncbi:MAG: hypothetical protein U0Q18_30815 [Bryobacteraceae bacterium]
MTDRLLRARMSIAAGHRAPHWPHRAPQFITFDFERAWWIGGASAVTTDRASPGRLDPKATGARGEARGAQFIISTDAHHPKACGARQHGGYRPPRLVGSRGY